MKVNKKRKIYFLAILYVLILLCTGLVILNVTSHSKLDTQISIFSNEKNPIESRLAALWQAALYTDERVTRILIKALQDPNPFIKIEAGKLVRERREYKAVPYLIQNLSDNSKIAHGPSGTSLPMVKIISYGALKRITGKDMGPVESTNPVEVAETVRRWELWWHVNAERFGMKVSEIEPDYETVITGSAFPKKKRLELFMKAVLKGYPGLPDIIAVLLQKEEPDSYFVSISLSLVSQLKIKGTVPLVVVLLEKELSLAKEKGVSLTAARINEVLVQITGRDYGPLYKDIPVEKREKILSQWKSLKPPG